jgi:hypothetical protein
MTSQRATGPSEEAFDHAPLGFGKHIGKTPNEISEIDPGYIVWLYENTEGNVSRALYVACRNEVHDDTPNDPEDW